jgi:hypothetical protein
MRLKAVLGGLAGILMITGSTTGQQPVGTPDQQSVSPPVQAPSPSAQWRDQAVPLLAQILRQKAQLGLSKAQVESIERLSLDFAHEAIRRQAEWQIALVDLTSMLDPSDPTKPLDLARLEAKIREISVAGGELEMMRLRAIETGKAQLHPEQRVKLVSLLNGDDPPDPPEIAPTSAPRSGGGFPGHPGGGGPRPPGGGAGPHPPGGPGHVPGHPPGHFPGHPHGGGGFVGVWPAWPWYWWWGYPGPAYPAPPAPAPYWYYCPAYGAYYPNVPSCPEPWVPVPAG